MRIRIRVLRSDGEEILCFRVVQCRRLLSLVPEPNIRKKEETNGLFYLLFFIYTHRCPK